MFPLQNQNRRKKYCLREQLYKRRQDLFPTLYLYFTSDRDGSGGKTAATGRAYSQLYRVSTDGSDRPRVLAGNVNGKYNDAAATLDAAGDVMWFTRNNYAGSKMNKDGNDVVNFILSEARRQGEEWKISNQFPYNREDISIELSSHTDSRGDDRYNEKLSARRAEAAVAFLLTRGISEDRLQAAGYGEKILVNDCKNDVRCTEQQHQKNRRTEIKILKR